MKLCDKQQTKFVTWPITAIMIAAFVYGMIFFSDAPIGECATGFCGRQGQSRTAEEYQSYKHWLQLIFVVWPVGILALAFIRSRTRAELGAKPDEPSW